MTSAGPPELGRGVVVAPGQAPPEPWSACARIVVDDDTLASPAAAVAALHDAWLRREPFVVELACDPDRLREPETCGGPIWSLSPSFELERERLHFLVWANTYDARAGAAVWWHGRKAARTLERHQIAEGGPADLVDGDGAPLYADGGPFPPPPVAGARLLHRWSVEEGSLRSVGHGPSRQQLAADQRAAVEHGAGPARIVAPAGSGKTRVLTARLEHLLEDRRAAPSSVMAVAFNEKAAAELRSRTGLARSGEGAQVRTINSLGLWICTTFGRDRVEVLGNEWEVRELVQKVFQVRRQANTDTVLPYLDALSAVRLGLQPPARVERTLPDAAGFAQGFDRYREALRQSGAVDYDEQIYRAIERLCTEPAVRREAQARCRTLLVDEFQDLNPAHLLLLRLLCAPAFDCFGVGDDDQVIYGYSGATPEFLLDFDRYFPGASTHPLEVNYRCPPAVVTAAATLLSYNDRRVVKTIRPAPASSDALPPFTGPLQGAGPVLVAEADLAALPNLARAVLTSWSDAGVGHADMAVLSRVNSVLLPVQVDLTAAGIPCTRPLDAKVLERTGARAALAYLRMGLSPDALDRRDIELTVRRPSRGIARNVVAMLLEDRVTSLAGVRRLAGRLSGRDGPKVAEYAEAIGLVAARCRTSAAAALRAVRTEIGLGATMDVLDSSHKEADRSTHLDDLVALESVAALHPDVAGFETWLRTLLGSAAPEGPAVLLSTIHKIKGREWDYVVVYGANQGTLPHRLSDDEEGERRIFHVAVTRARRQVAVLADRLAPSPFVAELSGARLRRPVAGSPDGRQRRPRPGDGRGASGREPAGRRPRRSHAGEPSPEATGQIGAREAALRSWRADAARRASTQAFLVLHDAHLRSIAERDPSTLAELAACAGIGPVKLERWGDEILEALAATSAD